ncbi:Short palate, lung and nasal epithelium carcinoma-associated protein 2A, partial [Varanus komodoensis]
MDAQIWKQHLQKLPLHETLKGSIKPGGLLGGIPIVGGLVNSLLDSILGVRIKNVELLKLDIQFDEREKHIFITIPADLEVEIHLPLHLGRLLRIKLFLDVQVGVQLFTDPSTGYTRLVLGNCRNNPGHVRVTVLD